MMNEKSPPTPPPFFPTTSGIKGNYEPLRDFDEVGNGENGTAFHVSKKKEEKVAEMVQIYGKDRLFLCVGQL